MISRFCSARPETVASRRPMALMMTLALAGCATDSLDASKTTARYRCEQNVEFTVRFVDDSALVDSSRGYSVLYRDAGGQGEGQPVYSNAMVRAEFGLGTSAREAILRYPLLPLVVRCVRD